MNFWSRNDYLNKASEADVDANTALRAITQAKALEANGIPPLLTLKHLTYYTDTDYHYLRKIVGRRKDAYHHFWITKMSGGKRLISTPNRPLLKVQQWIHNFILVAGKSHTRSFAYANGCSPLKCASQHVGCKWLIKVDIQSFFESISEIQVYRVYRSLGLNALIAFELSRLCTRTAIASSRYQYENWQTFNEYKIDSYNNKHIGYLPQGAPTSPILSNLTMYSFDTKLSQIAGKFGLVYTRYSDDITFSTSDYFTRKAALKLISQTFRAMKRIGLRPKTTKTVIAPPGARKIVLGLLVDTDKPRLSKDFRNNIEKHLHFINRFSPEKHALKRHFFSVLAMRRHIHGLITYAKSVEPEYGSQLENKFQQIQWKI